jgi:2-amino-4-hydroxy-6-hydroxymethyldihydropteridine diphosphokinase
MRSTSVLIAMGGNLPFCDDGPQKVIADAMVALQGVGLPVLAQSRLFGTPCFPVGAGPDYVNGAAILDGGEWAADEILAKLHEVEAMFGRARQKRWGGRTLDLDLLAVGDSILPDETVFCQWFNLPADQQSLCAPDRLILPHPRMHQRAFVLVPLMDVAPDWVHPVIGKSVAQLCDDLDPSDRDAVIALKT